MNFRSQEAKNENISVDHQRGRIKFYPKKNITGQCIPITESLKLKRMILLPIYGRQPT